MKKFLSIIMFSLSIFFISNNVYAANVKITNVELDSKSDDAVINKDATFSGLEVDTDVHFMMKDDFVKYKITITNSDNEDYKIVSNTNNNSDYVEYTYENVEDIKANSTEIIYMTIKYKNLVEGDKYDDNNKYSESNVETLTLNNMSGEIVNNPSTFSNTSEVILFVGIILMLSGMGVILIKGKKKNILPIILLGIVLIPIVCNATGLVELKVNSKVDFDYANDKFCVSGKLLYFREGMTFNDFFASDYFDEETDGETLDYDNKGKSFNFLAVLLFNDKYLDSGSSAGKLVIKNKENGCYCVGRIPN